MWYFLREINDIIVKFLIDVVCVLFNIYFVILKENLIDVMYIELELNLNVIIMLKFKINLVDINIISV